MKKKLLSLPILLMFVFSVLSVSMISVSAVVPDFPAIMVVPAISPDPSPDTDFTVAIETDYSQFPPNGITAYQFSLSYNPSVIQGVEVSNASSIITGGSADFIAGTFDNTAGTLSLTAGYYKLANDFTTETGILAEVTFTVVGEGASTITLGTDTKLYGWNIFDEQVVLLIDAETMPNNIGHGYFQNSAVTHDIAVTGVTPSSTSVLVDDSVDIMVNVTNQGNINEAFDVTAYANESTIGTQTVTNLGSGLTTTLTFTWDTSVALGTYTISATAAGHTLVSVQTVEVHLPMHLPVAVISITTEETTVYVDEIIVFDGGSSYDDDGGTITAFFWDLDDGTTATTQDTLHEYEYIGTYHVSLVVTDSQDQVSGPAIVTITVEAEPPVPPDFYADLVKWKGKAEAKMWRNSTDDDGLVTLTALALNQGTLDVNVTISYTIIDYKTGGSAGPVIYEDRTLDADGLQVEITTDLDPYDYTYSGEKKVLTVEVTLTYDSDGSGTPDTEGLTKTFRFTVNP